MEREDHLARKVQRLPAGVGAVTSRLEPGKGAQISADAIGGPVGGLAGAVAVDGLVEDGIDDVCVKGDEGLDGLQGGAREEAKLVKGRLEVEEEVVDHVKTAVGAKEEAAGEQTGHRQRAAGGEGDAAAALNVSGKLAKGVNVVGELCKVLLVTLGRPGKGGAVDVVDGLADGSEAAGEKDLAEALRVHGEVGEGDEAAVGLSEDGPRSLGRGPAVGETLTDGLAVTDRVVLAHEAQVAGLGVGIAQGRKHGGGHGRAHADAAVVEKQQLVAASKNGPGDGVLVGLPVAEAGPTLEVDHVGLELGAIVIMAVVVVLGREYGPLQLTYAAGKEGDGAA
ncbi:hypothetical protein G6O67_007209 [Ophiocordyceps sinensis]|uniref:Uncharacterized protein n=1 Tax=Ophiocordyceps sinensis TaxID=72228 RepID=A0A8H4PLM9_9HYPO|nr:hypothetical protein G6O67_007209 [Ophiocordyceps sinensis]